MSEYSQYEFSEQLYFEGEWKRGAAQGLVSVINPYDGSEIAQISQANKADLDTALQSAESAQRA